MGHAIITFVYSMYLFTNKPWKIVLDGYATLLVGNRYNHTFVLMNLVLCAHNNYNETRNYYVCLLHVLVYQQALENSARWLCYAISR